MNEARFMSLECYTAASMLAKELGEALRLKLVLAARDAPRWPYHLGSSGTRHFFWSIAV